MTSEDDREHTPPSPELLLAVFDERLRQVAELVKPWIDQAVQMIMPPVEFNNEAQQAVHLKVRLTGGKIVVTIVMRKPLPDLDTLVIPVDGTRTITPQG